MSGPAGDSADAAGYTRAGAGQPERVVSLVPSLTDLAARLGAGPRLVGVTDWCRHGAPAGVARLAGTKTPHLARTVALRPDLVLANTEENRSGDLERLRAEGIAVHETFPRRVADVPAMMRGVGEALGIDAEPLAAELERALADAPSAGAWPRVLLLVWRKPWIAAGPDTYSSDLLHAAGLRNALTEVVEGDERWPRVDRERVAAAAPDVVLLPSEPYAFGTEDLDAVAELTGGCAARFVDGEALTWHGPRTAAGLRELTGVVADVGRHRGTRCADTPSAADSASPCAW
ncbi:hypothetical protein ER308_00735 [Egibacter rhizosphaerae]|uniref:Fe/B12 periplasmic-binding domain-containing protein n=1 Tax=Egibacter rhizosphaerae TaxID=1670831 RepID=A0A411YAL5_9ACTN|nr:helical backbone metal receptor [Egibacter rhizosphaerae]QBI18241.1 hypothetical protein ER308_00735 [Egibacter rhizosphaerae]